MGILSVCVRRLRVPYTISAPVAFMENIVAPWSIGAGREHQIGAKIRRKHSPIARNPVVVARRIGGDRKEDRVLPYGRLWVRRPDITLPRGRLTQLLAGSLDLNPRHQAPTRRPYVGCAKEPHRLDARDGRESGGRHSGPTIFVWNRKRGPRKLRQ